MTLDQLEQVHTALNLFCPSLKEQKGLKVIRERAAAQLPDFLSREAGHTIIARDMLYHVNRSLISGDWRVD